MKYKIFSVLALLCSMGAQSHEFTGENLMLSYLKLKGDFNFESNVQRYMIIHNRDDWFKYKNDEFLIEDKKIENISRMKSLVDSFDLNEEFTINTDFNISKYNFNKESFPLSGIKDTTYYGVNYITWGRLNDEQYRVFFENHQVILNEIKMPKSKARKFLADRKSKNGSINRSFPAEISFKITNIKKTIDGSKSLYAAITKANIYEDEAMVSLISSYDSEKFISEVLQ